MGNMHESVLRSKHVIGTHVPEQGTAVAHACSGAASVPDAVPDQQFLVLGVALAPRSDWRHVLAGRCDMFATAPLAQLPGFPVAHYSRCAKFCLPH